MRWEELLSCLPAAPDSSQILPPTFLWQLPACPHEPPLLAFSYGAGNKPSSHVASPALFPVPFLALFLFLFLFLLCLLLTSSLQPLSQPFLPEYPSHPPACHTQEPKEYQEAEEHQEPEEYQEAEEYQESEPYQEEEQAYEEYVEENQQDMEEEFADTAQDWEAPEEENVGDINPYTGMEYESNSVRMHPKRIGYVQVYDRSDHQWTDMTEWALLGYQERKKALLGKDYEPPIYLD